MLKKLIILIFWSMLPQISSATPIETSQVETATPLESKQQIQKLRKARIYNLSGHQYVGLVLFKKNKKKEVNKDIIDINYK